MKYIYLFFISIIPNISLFAQNNNPEIVYVNELVSTHFVCSEPIAYVDISTDKVQGDMPISNILRIKPVSNDKTELGIVTIVAQQYMVQYQLVYADSKNADKQISIQQEGSIGLIVPEISLTHEEMKAFSTLILQTRKKRAKERKRKYRMEARLNNIYTVGDYFLVDLTFKNKSNIQYDIDQIRFKVEDKKITKATNFQQVEVTPDYQFYKVKSFKKKYRNVFVFKKFTYPNKKVFTIELSEKQISGRNLILKIDYKEVLNADTF
ncbi:MAG: conjugative transposon protein TraN [Cyclobacteriaceae bacterium]|nr:conjugative transposon protein TraN [Cyclobacteriaceae bacterium]